MTTQKKGHRLRCERLAAMLVIALLAGICCFLPAVSEAEETVDLQDQSVIYLTGYVKWDGSDPETRLPVVRLVHVAEDGTAVSKRKETKQLIAELKKTNPYVESNLFQSVTNISLKTVIAYKDQKGVRHHFLEGYDGGPGSGTETETESQTES